MLYLLQNCGQQAKMLPYKIYSLENTALHGTTGLTPRGFILKKRNEEGDKNLLVMVASNVSEYKCWIRALRRGILMGDIIAGNEIDEIPTPKTRDETSNHTKLENQNISKLSKFSNGINKLSSRMRKDKSDPSLITLDNNEENPQSISLSQKQDIIKSETHIGCNASTGIVTEEMTSSLSSNFKDENQNSTKLSKFSNGINRLSSKVRKDKSDPFEEPSQVFDGDSLKPITSFQKQGMTRSQNTINCNQLDHAEIQGKSSTSTKFGEKFSKIGARMRKEISDINNVTQNMNSRKVVQLKQAESAPIINNSDIQYFDKVNEANMKTKFAQVAKKAKQRISTQPMKVVDIKKDKKIDNVNRVENDADKLKSSTSNVMNKDRKSLNQCVEDVRGEDNSRKQSKIGGKLSKLTKSANDKVMKIRAVSVDNKETVTDSICAQTKDAPTEKSQEKITRKIPNYGKSSNVWVDIFVHTLHQSLSPIL